jgi:hypothetical protein
MPTVYDLTLEQLTDRLVAWGEPAFRAKQVWNQLWRRAATYDAMPEVPPALRERLAADLPLGVEVLTERTADRGATRKALLRLGGEHVIETVLMGYPDRVTVCVSSQSGCAMGCTFCATGQMGLQNNLTAGEISAQLVWAGREAAKLPDTTPRRLTNMVFMGMGESIIAIYYLGREEFGGQVVERLDVLQRELLGDGLERVSALRMLSEHHRLAAQRVAQRSRREVWGDRPVTSLKEQAEQRLVAFERVTEHLDEFVVAIRHDALLGNLVIGRYELRERSAVSSVRCRSGATYLIGWPQPTRRRGRGYPPGDVTDRSGALPSQRERRSLRMKGASR